MRQRSTTARSNEKTTAQQTDDLDAQCNPVLTEKSADASDLTGSIAKLRGLKPFDKVRFLNRNDDTESPRSFARTNQNLLQAIRSRDNAALSRILSSAPDVALAIDEAEPRNSYGKATRSDWPVTPLSQAILMGQEDSVELLLQRSGLRDLRDAIKYEQDELLPAMESLETYFEEDSYSSFRYSRIFPLDYDAEPMETQSERASEIAPVELPARGTGSKGSLKVSHYPSSLYLRHRHRWFDHEHLNDSVGVALRSLMLTEGNVEALFLLMRRYSLSLKGAQFCDIGRTLWFYAAQNNIVSVLDALLDDEFPINLRATGSHFTSWREQWGKPDPIDPVPLNTTALWNAAWKGSHLAVSRLLARGALLSTQLLKMEQRLAADITALRYTRSDDGYCTDDSEPTHSLHRSSAHEDPDFTDDFNEAVSTLRRYIFGGETDNSSFDELLVASQGLKHASNLHKKWPLYPNPDASSYSIVAQTLLDYGASANPWPKTTPIPREDWEHIPVLPVVHSFASMGAQATVQLLTRHGAHVYTLCSSGKTLLHYAIQGHSEDLTRHALELGIEVNQEDFLGYAPIHECILRGTSAILQILLSHGADANKRTHAGFPALLISANLGDLGASRILQGGG